MLILPPCAALRVLCGCATPMFVDAITGNWNSFDPIDAGFSFKTGILYFITTSCLVSTYAPARSL